MPSAPAFRIALYLLVVVGVVALHLGELIGPAGLGLVGALLAASWWSASRPVRPGPSSILARAVAPAAAAASAVDVLVLAPAALDALVRLLVFLALYKLFTLRSVRDTRIVTFLAFFMLVAASSSAFGVGFLVVFLAFVTLVTWVLLLQETLGGSDAQPGRVVVGGALAGHGRVLAALAVGAAAGAVAITAVFFFVIPRVGLAALPFRAGMGQMVTGFTDRVELGVYGQIETDPTVIMRVHIAGDMPDADRLPLRWRGIVFDEFDGRAWNARPTRRMSAQRAVGGDFWVSLPRASGPLLRQEIFLEPIGTDVVFAAARAVRFRLRTDTVYVDDMGSVTVPAPLARLSYSAESELEWPGDGRRRVAAPPLDAETRARFLQLPSLSPRITELARRVAGDSPEPEVIARRLERFLSQEFRYTLTLEQKTGLEPLLEFLFVRRSGNCEYFAAALAVMLRSLGVPARVVGGFQRGEWNPYGRYFMVRLSDAHSWVEAHLGPAGWVTLDPSPRPDARGPSASWALRLYLDAVRMAWYRYVINWTIRDQVYAAVAIRRQALAWRAWLSAPREWLDARGLAAAALLSVGGWLAWRLARRLPTRAAAGVRVRTLRVYDRALRLLARRGLVPAPGETAREFSARVARAAPGWAAPFNRLTGAYERCRFGGAALAAGEATELDACLAALRRGPMAETG
jgi:transglutaminase-like putative cysteine protease